MFRNYNGSCGYFIVFYNCFYFQALADSVSRNSRKLPALTTEE